MNISSDVTKLLAPLVGEPCTRQAVGRMKSLSLGFGDKAECVNAATDKQYRIWEIGNFGNSAWRITEGGNMLIGSLDLADSLEESNTALGQLSLGRFSSLKQPSVLDVRIEFDGGLAVEFFTASSADDESFHIFCPGSIYIEFSVLSGGV